MADAIKAKLQQADDEELDMLDLSWSEIDDDALATLVEALPTAPRITQIWLNNNQITDAGVAALCAVLPGSNVAKLWMNGNRFGDDGLAAIADTLTKTDIDEFWYVGLLLHARGNQDPVPNVMGSCVPQVHRWKIYRRWGAVFRAEVAGDEA